MPIPFDAATIASRVAWRKCEARRFIECAEEPVFSPDSRHLAYAAFRRGLPRDGQRIVLDGADGEIFDQVTTPVFSRDNAHCGYLARQDQKWFAVVDGQRTKPVDRVFPDLEPKLAQDGSDGFHFIGVEAGKLVRVLITFDRRKQPA